MPANSPTPHSAAGETSLGRLNHSLEILVPRFKKSSCARSGRISQRGLFELSFHTVDPCPHRAPTVPGPGRSPAFVGPI